MASEEIKLYGLDGGDPPAEAEDFIAAIKKSAFKECKQRDNDWLCDFTATCFRGEALRWFAKLEMEDPQVVESWKLLQNAILTHYPRPAEKTEEDDASDMEFSAPTSASSRPGSSAREGPSEGSEFHRELRIRVLSEDGECLGYLGRATSLLPDYWEGCLDAACDEVNAFRVIIKPGIDGTRLSRIFVLGPDKWLGIKWEKSFRSRAAVALFDEAKGGLTSGLQPHRWMGQAGAAVWEINSDRKIVPKWYKEKGPSDTFGFIAYEPSHLAGGSTIVHVKSQAENYALRNIRWDLVTLELEDC